MVIHLQARGQIFPDAQLLHYPGIRHREAMEGISKAIRLTRITERYLLCLLVRQPNSHDRRTYRFANTSGKACQ